MAAGIGGNFHLGTIAQTMGCHRHHVGTLVDIAARLHIRFQRQATRRSGDV